MPDIISPPMTLIFLFVRTLQLDCSLFGPIHILFY